MPTSNPDACQGHPAGPYDPVTQTAYEALSDLAERAANDIAGDFPGVDTAYDLYTGRVDGHGIATFGVIDMGDVYQAVFEWYGGEWCPTGHDPADIRDRIVRGRS